MHYFDEINSQKNIFITNLFEPDENELEFELTIGRVSNSKEEIIINWIDLSSSKIFYDKESPKYKVFFETYIAYTVINESYENGDGKDFTGNKIRIYKNSNFLDYLKKATFATLDYPGDFKHYCFVSLTHTINVASLNEPKIIKLILK